MMDRQSIEKIEEMVNAKHLVKSGDRDWTPTNLKPIIFNPIADAIEVHTLSGLADFISNDIDKAEIEDKYFVHVSSPEKVELMSAIKGEDRKREVLLVAKIDKELDSFPFGTFMSQEEFAIRFRSMFEIQKGDDSEYVLSFTSKLTGGTSIDVQDDGVTQNVGVKKGVSGALKATEAAKPIVLLAPFRTFRDIVQPASQFLLRIRLSGDVPTVALFEADGGRWRNEAVKSIAEFISARLPMVKVIA